MLLSHDLTLAVSDVSIVLGAIEIYVMIDVFPMVTSLIKCSDITISVRRSDASVETGPVFSKQYKQIHFFTRVLTCWCLWNN
jgi:hypothetical protein